MRLSEAKSLRAGQIVYIVGAYNADGTPAKARVSGKVRTWVTNSDRVQVPVKHGLRDSGYITETNLKDFTLKAPAKKVVKKTVRRVSSSGISWITQPGTYHTWTGANEASHKATSPYAVTRIYKGRDGLFRIQWRPA